jgi:flagellar biosynthesis protein FlhB
MLAGSVSVLLQTGFLLNTHALTPDPGRLDPRRGLKRVFGVDNLVETGKGLAKLVLLGSGLITSSRRSRRGGLRPGNWPQACRIAWRSA